MRVSHVTMLVSNLDKALDFYTHGFGAEVRDDQAFEFGGQPMRWLTVGFPGDALELVLSLPMPAPGKADVDAPGNGTMTVLAVDDCDAATARVQAAGGTVSDPPADLPWGRSAIVRDPDGNPFNLVQA